MASVNVTKFNIDHAYPYGTEEIYGKLGRKDDKNGKAEKIMPYLICDGKEIKIDKRLWAANESEQKSSAASFASGLRDHI